MRLAYLAVSPFLMSCAGTVVRDGSFVVAHRGNVGIITQVADNGAGTIALGQGPGNGVQVSRLITEMEASQPGAITIQTPSGGLVRIEGPVSYSSVDEAVASGINRGLRTGMIGRAVSTVTGGVVDLGVEAIDKIE